MIDLGKKQETMDMIQEIGSEKYYPKLYLSDIEGLDEAPEVGTEGTAKIKFRVVSKNESEREQDGKVKEKYAVDIDVTGIEFDSKSTSTSEEDDIEKGLSDSEKEMEDEKED